MTYKVQRQRGYEPWGVTNPFVFANYGQPQRQRGYVSPMVFQTHPPRLMNDHLGQDFVEEDRRRAQRMEWVAFASLALSAGSMWFFYNRMSKPTANRGSKRGSKRKPRRNSSLDWRRVSSTSAGEGWEALSSRSGHTEWGIAVQGRDDQWDWDAEYDPKGGRYRNKRGAATTLNGAKVAAESWLRRTMAGAMGSAEMVRNARRRLRRNIGHVTAGTRVHGPRGTGTVAEVHGENASVRWDSGGGPKWVKRSALDRL